LALHFTGILLQFDVPWMHYREVRDWLESAIEVARKLLEEDSAGVSMPDFILALRSLGWQLVTHGDMIDGHSVLDESIYLARKFGEYRLLAFALGMKAQAMNSSVTSELIGQLEESIARCRKYGYEMALIFALFSAGQAYLTKGDLEKGRRNFNEVIELAENFDSLFIKSWLYYAQSIEAQLTGKTAEAEKYFLLVIDINEKLGNQRMAATARSELAHLYRRAKRWDEAASIYRQTILSWQEQGHQAAVAHQLECFAYLAIARGKFEGAAQLLGAAQISRERTNSLSSDQREITEREGATRWLEAEIGAEALERLVTKGKEMSLDQAVTFALREDQGELR
jgi:ATP/maltotriose-dependent transcriptional regulator MalT